MKKKSHIKKNKKSKRKLPTGVTTKKNQKFGRVDAVGRQSQKCKHGG
jgi:hypothetical protein